MKRKILNQLDQPYEDSLEVIKKLESSIKKFNNAKLIDKESFLEPIFKQYSEILEFESYDSDYFIPNNFDVVNEFCKRKTGYKTENDLFLLFCDNFYGDEEVTEQKILNEFQLLENNEVTYSEYYRNISKLKRIIEDKEDNVIEYEVIIDKNKDYKLFFKFYESMDDKESGYKTYVNFDIFTTIDYSNNKEFLFQCTDIFCDNMYPVNKFLNLVKEIEKSFRSLKKLNIGEVNKILKKLPYAKRIY